MDITSGLRALLNRHTPSPPPRYAPLRPLPPYGFVPRHFPHPVRDPRGHSFGTEVEFGSAPSQGTFLQHPGYRYTLDLFNHGYYWEAHEGFEAFWMSCDESDPRRAFFQGLLRLAAAGVKARGGLGRGVASHATKAAALFQAVESQVKTGTLLGLSPGGLRKEAEQLSLKAYGFSEAVPMPKVEVVLPIVLRPGE